MTQARVFVLMINPSTNTKFKIPSASSYAAKRQIKALMELHPDSEFMVVYEKADPKASEHVHHKGQEQVT